MKKQLQINTVASFFFYHKLMKWINIIGMTELGPDVIEGDFPLAVHL